jgi:hypothetical protein
MLVQAQLDGDRGDVNVIDISLAALQLARTDRNWRSSPGLQYLAHQPTSEHAFQSPHPEIVKESSHPS